MKYKNNLTGVLLVNKPKGITSRDVVNKIQKIFNTKAGHTGTLDPIATGLMIVTLGKATKISEILASEVKEYEASAILGFKTDTLDTDGNVLENYNCNVSKDKLEKVINSFKGSYIQEVPKYSAIKINGKKLYEYARNNENIVLPKRKVYIYDINLINYKINNDKVYFSFKVKVSKGTYIRSLIRDIALKLGTVGVMSDLIRISQGNFYLNDAYSLEEIGLNNYKLLSIKDALDIPVLTVDKKKEFRVVNGQKICDGFDVIMYLSEEGNPLAIYKNNKVWKMLK